MNVTSIHSYWKGRTSKQFSEQASLVLDSLDIDGPATRSELARRLNLRMSAICGRVHELVKAELVEEYTQVPDPDTLRNVWALRLKGV